MTPAPREMCRIHLLHYIYFLAKNALQNRKY